MQGVCLATAPCATGATGIPSLTTHSPPCSIPNDKTGNMFTAVMHIFCAIVGAGVLALPSTVAWLGERAALLSGAHHSAAQHSAARLWQLQHRSYEQLGYS